MSAKHRGDVDTPKSIGEVVIEEVPKKLRVEVGVETLISPELLREELDVITSRLVEVHPQPFSRISKEAFDIELMRIRSSLKYPLSRSNFYLQVGPLVASLKDSHSFVSLPKDQLGDFSLRGEKLFPLAIFVHENDIYVASDLTKEGLIPSGAQIISINKTPIGYVLDIMRSLTARETLSGQSRRVQLDFSWLLSAMGISSADYEVEYRWLGGVNHAVIEGIDIQPVSEKRDQPSSFYGYSQLTSSVALMWLNDFNETPEVFDRFLNEKFALMSQHKMDNLIIDVRYNKGGLSENLKNLLSRLTEKPIYWARRGSIKVSDTLKRSHRHKTKKRRKDKYHWGLQLIPLEWTDSLQHSIWWSEPGDTIELELDPVQPSSGFKPVRVWVLANGYCFSACSFFVASMNYYALGKTMGEAAGSLVDYQFVYPVQIKLPHSGLLINLPTMRLDFVESEQKDLIEPKEEVLRRVNDIIERKDPVLSRALREAEQGLEQN